MNGVSGLDCLLIGIAGDDGGAKRLLGAGLAGQGFERRGTLMRRRRSVNRQRDPDADHGHAQQRANADQQTARPADHKPLLSNPNATAVGPGAMGPPGRDGGT